MALIFDDYLILLKYIKYSKIIIDAYVCTIIREGLDEKV
ncbi:hypothetical protein CAAU_0606 [Caloramator australicus RC3]|uniref:Uncharacterized protein n=1 Tax=Caloramator australicus RC3 TaxID=857293 RepID=I7LFQ5_9CLOT|nr:hypothetical protein CAAU_0606 [Caloramator australicus RC3]